MGFIGEGCGEEHGGGEMPTVRKITIIKVYMNTRCIIEKINGFIRKIFIMNDFDNNKLFAAERFHAKNKRKFIGMNSDITVRIRAEFFHHIIPGADDNVITDVVGGVGG